MVEPLEPCPSEAGPPIVALVAAVRGRFVAEFDARLADTPYADLTLAHSANVLRWLHAGPARAQDLAARCEVSKQAISQLVQQLLARGYVAAAPDPADERARVIALTPRGQAAQDCIHALFVQLEAEWAAQVGPERYAECRSVLADLTTPCEQERGCSEAVVPDAPRPAERGAAVTSKGARRVGPPVSPAETRRRISTTSGPP